MKSSPPGVSTIPARTHNDQTSLPFRGMAGKIPLTDRQLLEFICAVLCVNSTRMMEVLTDDGENKIETGAALEFAQMMVVAGVIAGKDRNDDPFLVCAEHPDSIFQGGERGQRPQEQELSIEDPLRQLEAILPEMEKEDVDDLAKETREEESRKTLETLMDSAQRAELWRVVRLLGKALGR